MQTILIIGSDFKLRQLEADKLLNELKISPFDRGILSGEKTISIEDVKNIKKKLIYKSFISQNRAVLIHNFDQATIEAQNALLKTLEEPPANTYIILTAQNSDSLLPTIISRVQIIKLKVDKIDSNSDSIIDIFDKLNKGTLATRLSLAQEIGPSREDALLFIKKSITDLRMSLLNHYNNNKQPADFILDPILLTKLIRKLFQAQEFIEQNVNTRLTLEVLFIGL